MANWTWDNIVMRRNGCVKNGLLELYAVLKPEIQNGDYDEEGQNLLEIIEKLGIEISNLIDPSAIIHEATIKDDIIMLKGRSRWFPRLEAYKVLADCLDLTYVYYGGDSRQGMHINTDIEGEYFTDRYILTCGQVDLTGTEIDLIAMIYGGETFEKLGDVLAYFKNTVKIILPTDILDDFKMLKKYLEGEQWYLEQYVSHIPFGEELEHEIARIKMEYCTVKRNG